MKEVNASVSELPDVSRTHGSPSSAVNMAIAELQTALWQKRYLGSGRERAIAKLRRDMPYVLWDATSLPGTRILLNRNYKPVGSNIVPGGKIVDYDDYPNLHVRLHKVQIQRLCSPRESALFDDGNPPWRGRKEAKAYLIKLQYLEEILTAQMTQKAA